MPAIPAPNPSLDASATRSKNPQATTITTTKQKPPRTA